MKIGEIDREVWQYAVNKAAKNTQSGRSVVQIVEAECHVWPYVYQIYLENIEQINARMSPWKSVTEAEKFGLRDSSIIGLTAEEQLWVKTLFIQVLNRHNYFKLAADIQLIMPIYNAKLKL